MNIKKNRWSLPIIGLLLSVVVIAATNGMYDRASHPANAAATKATGVQVASQP